MGNKKNNHKKTDIFPEDLEYNLEELAIILGTSIYTLRRRISDGRLKASKIFGVYKVTRAELNDFLLRECINRNLEYFNKKGDLYKKECLNEDHFKDECIYLVETVKVLALSDAAKIYYENKLYERKVNNE